MLDKNKGFTRRDFIKKSAATMGLLAVLSSPFIPVLNRAKASASTSRVASRTPSSAIASSAKGGVRQWCMVIDLKRCDGCVGLGIPPQCTQSCIMGRLVPDGMKWIEVYQEELPGGGSFFMPAPCYQCENAPCVPVCPVGATYHVESGVVLIDQRRCIGCRFCMAACPYQRRFFNWGTPKLPPEAAFIEYTPERQIPAIKGTVMKCDFCTELMRQGKLPYCVAACPRKVLYMGDLNEDVASNGVEVVKLSKFLDDNNAYRYKEHLGTQPRTWYLPGHGQDFGRHPDDPRQLLPTTWPWGGDGFRRPGVWPWKKSDKWTWEEQVD